MTPCRVYVRADGTVAVVKPMPKSRRADEPEAEWLARVWARFEEANPQYAGLPHHEEDAAALPDRAQRNKWRVKQRGGRARLEVDPDA